MRVAYFSEVAWPMISGVALTLDRTARAFEARGHAVRIYSATYPLPEGEPDRRHTHRSPSAPLLVSPEVQWARPRSTEIIADLREFRPDIVHCLTEFVMGRAGLRAARALGVPLVASAHTDYERYARTYGLGWAVTPGWHYLRSFYRQARLVLAPTASYERHLNARQVMHTGIWSRGVDLAEFHPQFRREEIRAGLGIPPGDLMLLYVGRIAPEKNVLVLLDAWAQVAEQVPRAHLVFVGNGLMEPEVRRRGLPRVVLAGTQRDRALAHWYASADLFVLPSATETFGNVLLEAMASGVACVAAAAGGVLDIARNGQDAVLVAPNDPGALARALCDVLGDRVLRMRLANAGLATAQRRSWGPVHDRLLSIYADVIISAPSAEAA